MLYQDFDAKVRTDGTDVFKRRVPEVVAGNVRESQPLREYQKEALGRLEFYLGEYQGKQLPVELLFNMATGSGKTLVMAGAMLHLYTLGYRNFIFFTRLDGVVRKTIENFTNPQSAKYLFAQKIVIGGREVRINQVDNFASASPDDINIKFQTIGGLHLDLHNPRENRVTFEELAEHKIVLLGDEAHNFNAATKKERELERSWEQTIDRLLRGDGTRQNIFLAFTATIDWPNDAIAKKYQDKTLYRYDLAEFRADGFSKDIEIAGRSLEPMARALGAVVLSQYRRKVAEHHGLQLKPVVLFKSKTIKESEEFEAAFHEAIRTLKAPTIKALRPKASDAQKTLADAFAFFEANGVTLADLAREIKDDFAPERCRSVNSKNDTEEKQLEMNSLEDKHNLVRAVFAVDKLNEGWDVLNLFDIVRLYEARQSGGRTISPATMAEAQLIGRGARYWPFSFSPGGDDRYVRKYDEDISNELRVLEQLHYHSKYDSRYIAEIRTALQKTGALPQDENIREYDIQVKESIKKTVFWKDGHIFLNTKRHTKRAHITSLMDVPGVKTIPPYELRKGGGGELGVFAEAGAMIVRETTVQKVSIPAVVWREATYRLPFYQFNTLASYFPHLTSMADFVLGEKNLGGLTVEARGEPIDLTGVTREDELAIALHVLCHVEHLIQHNTSEYEGTKEFEPQPIHTTVRDKHIKVAVRDSGEQEFGVPMKAARDQDLQLDLATKDWYVYEENYGTKEEKQLVHFINDCMSDLKKRYSNVHLLRNERLFKLYRFSDGAAIEPDFVLFLREAGKPQQTVYQLFIEPKGEQLRATNKWKEDFLLEIEAEGKSTTLFENAEYRIVGLPFYTHDQNEAFDEAFAQFE